MKITVEDLVVLFAMLAAAFLLTALGDLVARALERFFPTPDPIDHWLQPSHVKELAACRTCGEPSDDLQPYTDSPMLDPEPTCPGCIERARTERMDLLHISIWDAHRERI